MGRHAWARRAAGVRWHRGPLGMAMPDGRYEIGTAMVASLRWSGAIGAACVSLFFFQAEDGIRDGTVTGVQTCALPISIPLPESSGLAGLRESGFGFGSPRCLALLPGCPTRASLASFPKDLGPLGTGGV